MAQTLEGFIDECITTYCRTLCVNHRDVTHKVVGNELVLTRLIAVPAKLAKPLGIIDEILGKKEAPPTPGELIEAYPLHFPIPAELRK